MTTQADLMKARNKVTFQIRHETLHSVINSIENAIKNKGYELPSEFSEFTFWSHVGYGHTQDENIQLTFNESRYNDGIAFQIYRDMNGMYELNLYFWR